MFVREYAEEHSCANEGDHVTYREWRDLADRMSAAAALYARDPVIGRVFDTAREACLRAAYEVRAEIPDQTGV